MGVAFLAVGAAAAPPRFDAPFVPVPVGGAPAALAVGDVDGDGRADLLVANSGSNTISVLETRAQGEFEPRRDYATGDEPRAVALADVDGDTDLDAVVANFMGQTLSVLRNDGGGFSQRTDIAAGGYATSVALGDLNGDGAIDVVLNHAHGQVAVLLGRGDGTFQPRTDIPTDPYPASVALADLNGDAWLDLIAITPGPEESSDGSLWVWLGQGNGAFASPLRVATGPQPTQFAVTDFDRDGFLDVAVAVNGPVLGDVEISLLFGSGDGAFARRSDLDGVGSSTVTTADADGDGFADLVTTGGGPVRVRLGNGDGTFAAARSFAAGAIVLAVEAGEFDGSPGLDLVAAAAGSRAVALLSGHGDGTFGGGRKLEATDPRTSTLADFDRDGWLDIASPVIETLGSRDVGVWLGRGDGTFGAEIRVETGLGPTAIDSADLDRDGHIDLVTVNRGSYDVSILRGLGDGSFAPRMDLVTASYPVDVAIADLNHDGALDLAVTCFLGLKVSIFLGQGDATFALRADFAAGNGPTQITIADLNDDDHPDLAVSNTSGLYPEGVAILLGFGDGTFGPLALQPAGVSPRQVAVGDWNSDGAADLAVASASAAARLLFGLGDGTFQLGAMIAPAPWPHSLAAADLNRDGKTDLVIGNSQLHTLSVLLGRGDGGFDSQPEVGIHGRPHEVAIADLDRDGRLDLVVPNASWSISILLQRTSPVDATLPRLVTRLLEPYPNPFNPRTTIRFELSRSERVSLAIYSSAGRRIARLVDEIRPAGRGEVIWDGTDSFGRPLSSGVYFVHLQSEGTRMSKKIALVR